MKWKRCTEKRIGTISVKRYRLEKQRTVPSVIVM